MRIGLALGALAGCGFDVPAKASRDGGHDGPIDGPIDMVSDAFTPAACPGTYAITHGTSRYLISTMTVFAWVASSRCAADLPGATHLVVFDSAAEQLLVQSDIDATSSVVSQYWIGAVQEITATQIGAGWLSLTGGPLLGFWSAVEPTDNDGGPPYDNEVHAEQFVRLDKNSTGMVDAPGGIPNHGYVCECDGKPIDPAAAQAITDSTGI